MFHALDQLFPYARQHMLEFVRNHWSDDALQEVIAQANRERSGKQDLTSAELLHNYMVDLMDGDAKATSLKCIESIFFFGRAWLTVETRCSTAGHDLESRIRKR